jgi:hypothetical protein
LPDALRFILVVVLMPGLNYPGEIAVGGFPTDWGLTRWPGNPVIDVDNNPNETTEQYTPAPIRLPNGDIWVYVKGFDRIYAWKSTDDGETFALQNGDDAVLEPVAATWEEIYVVDPVATYDPDTDTIHLYYKGSDILAGNDNWQWGHATAPGSDPTDVTKDGGNPIYTEADAIAYRYPTSSRSGRRSTSTATPTTAARTRSSTPPAPIGTTRPASRSSRRCTAAIPSFRTRRCSASWGNTGCSTPSVLRCHLPVRFGWRPPPTW